MWPLTVPVANADYPPGAEAIGPYGGLSFGQGPDTVDWLTTADPTPAGCVHETRYHIADARRRGVLSGIKLKSPGLVYRFIDDRLYAVQAEFGSSQAAFSTLHNHLVARYGAPKMSGSWQDHPTDSYVYQKRMQTMGWHDSGDRYAIWLTNGDAGGSIIMVDNDVADAGLQKTGEHCAGGGMDIADMSH